MSLSVPFIFLHWIEKICSFIKVSQEINHLDPGELEGFDSALLARLMMLEFGSHSHKISPNGSFDTAYGVDNIAENPLLAGCIYAHHSGEVMSFNLDASKKFMRCVTNENGEFIGQQ